MENDLKIYSKKSYTLGIGNIERIEYKGNTISQFNEKEGRIDLSVLNHFVNKNADYYVTNSETNEINKKIINIREMKYDKKIGWTLFFDTCK